jgi:hypothetical protein
MPPLYEKVYSSDPGDTTGAVEKSVFIFLFFTIVLGAISTRSLMFICGKSSLMERRERMIVKIM